VTKIIPFNELARQHHLNFLEHQCRDYREREDYLARLRKLLFQVEAQMRQAEMQQLEVFRLAAQTFKVELKFPDMGDRIALQRFFTENPFVTTLNAFFADRLSKEGCYEKIMELKAGEGKKSGA
jgi:hypothetical protein